MIAIINGTVIDPSATKPSTKASVLIEGDKIAAIAPDLPVPPKARVIDATGRYLVPGLWDMHAHVVATTEIGVAPEHYVGFGVLGIRDMGAIADKLFALRADVRAGNRVGPDIAMAGPTLNGEQAGPHHRVVRTDEEARAAVRESKEAGVDFIKMHRRTTREAFFAIADETKKLGLHFVGHVPLELGWIEASNAGMHTIEHIQTIFENEEPDPKKLVTAFPELVTRLKGEHGDAIWTTLKKNGTYFDPTLVAYADSIEKNGSDIAVKRRAAFGPMKELASRAAKAGVRILAGSDVLERHGELLLRELELLVEVGLTPQEALAAATTTACAALDRAGPGRIAIGAPASFLIVDADPLKDITSLRKLSCAVLRGRVIESEELAALRTLTP